MEVQRPEIGRVRRNSPYLHSCTENFALCGLPELCLGNRLFNIIHSHQQEIVNVIEIQSFKSKAEGMIDWRTSRQMNSSCLANSLTVYCCLFDLAPNVFTLDRVARKTLKQWLISMKSFNWLHFASMGGFHFSRGTRNPAHGPLFPNFASQFWRDFVNLTRIFGSVTRRFDSFIASLVLLFCRITL